ncbi:TfoX/Sxy family protein [Lysobacter capsici]|uniref:TfoX/Sxy family protein n=1 Tax=Lysobacter capsici TaxID=435897 RepID=UPI00287B9BDD|nr:TfoX/Sxy family protein [Lysobacter capsici]WND79040.1 TfoX/Sxy family protein [Lysobacter capsici]WND84235.1 TfoX/Sxy family protein [Lysobacter capsici]
MSADLIAHLQDVAADFGALSARRMFGGYGIYHDGVMIGLISDEVLYLKVDDQSRERFRAADSGPFLYTRRGETVPTSYWSVPEAAMESPQDMRPWLVLAYEAALRKANAAASKVGARKAGPIKAKSAEAKSASAKSATVAAGNPGVAKPKLTKGTSEKAKPRQARLEKPRLKKAGSATTKPTKPDAKRR